jgi:hypothetical protein
MVMFFNHCNYVSGYALVHVPNKIESPGATPRSQTNITQQVPEDKNPAAKNRL